MNWVDLAPTIVRQRLIIEGTLHSTMRPDDMSKYVARMGPALNMISVTTPMLNYNSDYGWCAYMHWKESGIHMYGWDHHVPPFFSVDIYTCKPFDPITAIDFTKKFFGKQLKQLTYKE